MKTAIITISKDNELYLDEWITYHHDIGFDKIFFLDNNSKNNNSQLNIVKKYDFCEWIDLRDVCLDGNSSSVGKLQKVFFKKTFDEHKNEFDWFLFIDIDEFLHTDMPVKEFLSQSCFQDTKEILLNWLCFGDNDLVMYDERPVQVRFTQPYTNTTCYSHDFPENEVTKCFVSGTAEIIEHNTHTAKIKDGKIKNALGNEIQLNWRQTPILHSNAYIKHYETKTIEEYINCRIRSKRCTRQEMLNRMHWFFNVNKQTKDKMLFVDFLNKHFK